MIRIARVGKPAGASSATAALPAESASNAGKRYRSARAMTHPAVSCGSFGQFSPLRFSLATDYSPRCHSKRGAHGLA
jgi:hypothetical protein